MVISAEINKNYNRILINQKYSPLDNITLNPFDQGVCERLFSNREYVLRNYNIFGDSLKLYAEWPRIEENKLPPMVVVSSNRAEWVMKGLENAKTKKSFTGYLDDSTFNQDIVPWYAPLRSGRHLFVIVHYSEYSYYKEKVGKFKDITVIGYEFSRNCGVEIVGFGASRFAAVQAMMALQYHRAWVVDDNVVNINGFPNTLSEIEELMTDTIWGIGFTAATRNYDKVEVVRYSSFQRVEYKYNIEPCILQQAVLWNLNFLRNANINFSPLFVGSNEDVSLSHLLTYNNFKIKTITSLHIIKANLELDEPAKNLGGNFVVPLLRKRIYNLFNKFEFDLKIYNGQGLVNLKDFVKAIFVPPFSESEILELQIYAVEQIMSRAISKNPRWYTQTVFNPYNKEDKVLPVVTLHVIPSYM